jgi:hypothetical protein
MFRHSRRIALLVVLGVATFVARPALATTTPANIMNTVRDYAATDASRDLLVRVDEALNALTYTYYTHNHYWNDLTGVYKTDCSGFANTMVEDATPEAFDQLTDRRDTSRPLAEDYYYLFRSIPYGTTRYDWTRVKKVSELRPGDVLVWKYKYSSSTTGHVMIVASKPVRDSRWSNVYKVRIADSANSGHGNDNRGKSGSGVGAGEILLRYSTEYGTPYAYAWNLNGIWHTDVSFAMARAAD